MKIVRLLAPLCAICCLAWGGGDGRPPRRQASDIPPSADFFVATNGSDAWSGKLATPNALRSDGPFASVAKAQLAVRGLLKTNPSRPVTVMLRAGTYYLPLSPTSPGGLNFTSSDSGTAKTPVEWVNYPGETPVISGGEPVGAGGLGLTWTNVSGSLWQVPLPAGTGAFEYLFYNGARRLRSRLESSSGTGYYMQNGACYSTQTKTTVDISQCNLGTFLRVAASISPTGVNASCPSVTNSEDTTQSKCLDRFQYNPADPIASFANLNPSGSVCGGGANAYPVGDIELTLFSAWMVDVMRVSCVDTVNHVLYFTGPTGKNPGSYAFFSPQAGHRYILENTRDAFDAARSAGQTGLWFLDRSKSPWLLNYLANHGENPNADSVVIAQVQPLGLTGGSLLSAVSLKYATFRGITFEVDNLLPPAAGLNTDENSEAAIPEAIGCESCQSVTFDAITVRHTSASGILIASTSGNSGTPAENDFITNSAFYDIGASGVRIGHKYLNTDKAAYVVQSVTVDNNVIQGYSRILADGEGIAQSNGHDILYQHNDISDGYHAAISICNTPCYGYPDNGSNIVSQYNHVWNTMKGITSDGGTIYYSIGGTNGSGSGNKILNNLVHDTSDSSIIDGTACNGAKCTGTGYGGRGIYLDGWSAGVDVENNVVYRVSEHGLWVSYGPVPGQPPNVFRNNIVAYARTSMFDDWQPWNSLGCATPALQAEVINNLFCFDKSDSSGFYPIQGCPYSCSLSFDKYLSFQGNLYWRTDGKFSTYSKAFHVMTNPPADPTTCGNSVTKSWTFFGFSQWQGSQALVSWGPPGGMNEDAGGSATINPNFGNTGNASDFLLSANLIPGFDYTKTNDTILHAGRSNPLIVPPTVPDTFPTYRYATADF